jgi:uncharacterized protein (DUF849 family)
MDEKLIVNFAPTGMIPTRAMTPHVPLTAQQVVSQVCEAYDLGITMVHLHARDDWGRPTYKAALYGKMIQGIRAQIPDLVICVSLSGRDFSAIELRSEPLTLEGPLKPDMGSLTLSSLNFNKVASVNAPDTIVALARMMKHLGIVPELEAFDLGMINYAKYLIRKGLLEPPYYFNLLVGNIACAQADLLHMGLLATDLPEGSLASFAGIGRYQLRANSIAIASGYGVRVGLEDNIWYDDERTTLATNAMLLRRVKDLAQAHGREIMRPSEFRERMGLCT